MCKDNITKRSFPPTSPYIQSEWERVKSAQIKPENRRIWKDILVMFVPWKHVVASKEDKSSLKGKGNVYTLDGYPECVYKEFLGEVYYLTHIYIDVPFPGN